MKIISRFKDYYDSISHQYLDKEILYLREKKIIAITRKTAETLPGVEKDAYKYYYDLRLRLDFDINVEIIGFCGKLYPVVSIKTISTGKTENLYDFESLKEYAKEIGIPFKTEKRRWRWRDYDFTHLADYERLFNSIEKAADLEKMFMKYQTPCFVYKMVNNQEYHLVVNPMLKEYGFMKVKDPFSAHQELYQFVSGYLNQPVNPMVQISDKDKIHKHGFDKWSFRQKGPKK